MNHEIFIQTNRVISNREIHQTVARLSGLSAAVIECVAPAVLAQVKNRLGKKFENKKIANCFSLLKNTYNLYLPDYIAPSVVLQVVDKLLHTDWVSKARYNGIACSENQFPSLEQSPKFNPDFYVQQHHFLSPLGVDSMYGWTIAGGNGDGITIFITDTQVSEHDDISYQIVGQYNVPNGTHGSNVCGVIAAKNNDISGLGIVPAATVYVSWFGSYDGVFELGKAGDVVNISAGYKISGYDYPWPIYEENAAKIILASEMGITTCYSSSNGSINLDTVEGSNGDYFLNKNDPSYEDNTGVCVGGGFVRNRTKPTRTYNYGSLIDVYAQSDNVQTVYGAFTGTSASTPIIAGLIAQIQSIYINQHGTSLSPLQVRTLISDRECGIEGISSYEFDHAVMPDLRKVLAKINITSPDVYEPDYGISQDEINNTQHLVLNLFADEQYQSLKDDVTLQDILDAQAAVYTFKPGETKIKLLNLIDDAIILYNDMKGGELVDNHDFSKGETNWLFQATIKEFGEDGVVLSGKNSRGVIGLNYNLPLSFNPSEHGVVISAKFNILEFDGENTPTATLGHYMAGLDAILNYSLYKQEELHDNTVEISFIAYSGYQTSSVFPGFGVKGVNKILLKEISVKPVL